MRSCRHYLFSAIFHNNRTSRHQGTCCVDHIIKHNGHFIGYITNKVHGLSLIGLITALVNNCKPRIQTFGKCPRPLHPASIRGNNNQFAFDIFLYFTQIL